MKSSLLLPLALLGCAPASDHPFVRPMEASAGEAVLDARDALRADIEVTFGGASMVSGRMEFDTSLSRARLDRADGANIVFDGDTAWLAPADADPARARFHVLTWPYFALAATKFDDPGVRLEPRGEATLAGETYDTARVTFAPGTGDAPDDWYLLYRERETGRLAAMAYIVTFGAEPGAPAEPHLVRYDAYADVEGFQVPTRMTFFDWSEDEGLGEQIGAATISEPSFIDLDPARFEAPEGAIELKL